MADRYPLTVDQLRQTKLDLSEILERSEEIARLMSAGYGESDPRAVRAQEAHAALLRLQWEMEREHSATA